MEIKIKLPNFKGSINGVTFSNEETLNATKNVLTAINEKFGEVYNNGFIDCLHDIFEDIESPIKRKNVEQELIDTIEQSDELTLDRIRFSSPTGAEGLTNKLNTCLYTGYAYVPITTLQPSTPTITLPLSKNILTIKTFLNAWFFSSPNKNLGHLKTSQKCLISNPQKKTISLNDYSKKQSQASTTFLLKQMMYYYVFMTQQRPTVA